MRIVKKEDCKFLNGYIVDDDSNVVNPGAEIVGGINDLDVMLQALRYYQDQPEYSPAPSMKGFKPVKGNSYVVKPDETPALDAKTEQAKAILEELDMLEKVEQTNCNLKHWSNVLDFIANDCIVDKGDSEPVLPFTAVYIDPVGDDFTVEEAVKIIGKATKLILE